MTYHTKLNYTCKSCEEAFLLFREQTPCPKCGTEADETFPIIDEIVEL